MILGLAHVALEVQAFGSELTRAVAAGWKRAALARGVIIPSEAASRYPAAVPRLDLALLRRRDSLTIELTQHVGSGQAQGAVDVRQDANMRVTGLATRAMDLEDALAFWIAAGAKCVRRSGDSATTTLRSVSPRVPVSMTVRRGCPVTSARIDGVGGAALAFVSTNVDDDMSALAAAGGIPLVKPFSIEIGGRWTSIAFLIAPGNVPVELIAARPVR